MNEQNALIEKISRLRRERNAIILAHNYVSAEIQAIADFCGDSLELSIKAADTDADMLIVCGVRFMAETAKILSPRATVVMVRSDAGCPMADMVDPDELKTYKAAHPDTILVAYVNTTAEVKALVDICCTSGNAEKIVSSLPADKEVMFLPDRNLGSNLVNKLHRPMQLWHGCCPVHDAVTVEMITAMREKFPNAQILVHPECRPEVVSAADQALSTGAMLNYVTASEHDEFVVGTESGILYRMMQANPGKKFHLLQPEILCADMKKLTLADVERALRTGKDEVMLSDEIIRAAESSIRKMLSVK
ncbi:MAG: quinolinate synthase NadA [Lentisphaeria bacterium]|nr:quinolinate synthase NadA [Lentisphaeria bacterium]